MATLELDQWLRKSKFKLDPERDLVVITGGGSENGLGHCIALEFIKNGFSVAVLSLDFEWTPPPPGPDGGRCVRFFECDVSDPEKVRAAREEIVAAFPDKAATVLVNNAGIAHNKTVLDMSEQTIQKVFAVNLLGAFWTVRTFVPGMRELGHGYIVNVSSILGQMGVMQLSAYCASKAGLIAFHDSLTHELSSPYNFYGSSTSIRRQGDISTLLVTPGHISTTMFSGVGSPNAWLGPILTAEKVGASIVDAVLAGETGKLSLPFFTRFFWLNQVLPGFIWEYVRAFSKLDTQMDRYIGNERS